jgi:hypothetical protein
VQEEQEQEGQAIFDLAGTFSAEICGARHITRLMSWGRRTDGTKKTERRTLSPQPALRCCFMALPEPRTLPQTWQMYEPGA